MSTKIASFGEVNFANADLGDARRSRRLAKTADLMCRRPGGSLPQKLNNPKDLKAFYRLVRREEVTHEAILAAHRKATQDKIDETRGPVLIIHDATELDYTKRRTAPTGNATERLFRASGESHLCAATMGIGVGWHNFSGLSLPLEDGKVRPIVDQVLPLKDACKAHDISQSGHVRGKLVLRVLGDSD